MNTELTRILLPVTSDPGFEKAASLAISLAKQRKAEILLAVIDDDSAPYSTVPLPFHEKELIHSEKPSERRLLSSSLGDRCAGFLLDASNEEVEVREVLAVGHAATQMLLLSRFTDLVVLSNQPHFPDRNGTLHRRVNPILEILDQTVVPVLVAGQDSTSEITSAALFFDGGPSATHSLHGLARVASHQPDLPLFVRLAAIDPDTAQRMGEECESFLRSKGYRDVSIEYSESSPLEAIETEIFTPVDLVAMGIRSKYTFHDLHVGVLAKHFLEHPGLGLTLFC